MKHKFTYNPEDVPRARLLDIIGRTADRKKRIKSILLFVLLEMIAILPFFLLALEWEIVLPSVILAPIAVAPIIHGIIALQRVNSIEEYQLHLGSTGVYLMIVSLTGIVMCFSTMTKHIYIVAVVCVAFFSTIQYAYLKGHLLEIWKKKLKDKRDGCSLPSMIGLTILQFYIIFADAKGLDFPDWTPICCIIVINIVFLYMGMLGSRSLVNYYLIRKMGIVYPEGSKKIAQQDNLGMW